MRLLSFSDFLTWPEGTLFCKYDSGAFHTVAFKDRSIERGDPVGEADEPLYIDYFYLEFVPPMNLPTDILETVMDTAETHPEGKLEDFYEMPGRDGTFDDDCKYLVWEPEDIGHLVGRLLEQKLPAKVLAKIHRQLEGALALAISQEFEPGDRVTVHSTRYPDGEAGFVGAVSFELETGQIPVWLTKHERCELLFADNVTKTDG